ncbi:MAG: hypothetical protein K2F99_08530 [Muribaculaceae bacterium]|nr:hypothetical protein [Muribaculaceae bacterium]
MMNPQDLDSILVHSMSKPGAIYVQKLELVEAISICEPIMSLQMALHRLTNDDPDIPIIRRNEGPKNKALGDVQPIWVGKYQAVSLITNGAEIDPSEPVYDQYTEIVIIYENDLNTVGIDDTYENV